MEESVACVRCSVNARHERKLKNKLGDCGCSLSNQLKAWIEKKKKKDLRSGKRDSCRRKAAAAAPWVSSLLACPAVTLVSPFLKINLYKYLRASRRRQVRVTSNSPSQNSNMNIH